jgi:hypothetical protein
MLNTLGEFDSQIQSQASFFGGPAKNKPYCRGASKTGQTKGKHIRGKQFRNSVIP